MRSPRRAGGLRRPRLGRWLVLGTALVGVHCASYNAAYNARVASARADQLLRTEREDSARVWYRRAAEAAEFVLAGETNALRTIEARYLAARGRALDGECAQAGEHARRWYGATNVRVGTDGRRPADAVVGAAGSVTDTAPGAGADADAEAVARLELALAICDLRSGEPVNRPVAGPSAGSAGAPAALDRLRALDAAADSAWPPPLRRDVRRWLARAALAGGAPNLADSVLTMLGDSTAAWERLLAAVAAERWEEVGTRLRERIARGEFAPALAPLLDQIGRRAPASTLVSTAAALDRASGYAAERARLGLRIGDAWLQRGALARADSLFAWVARRFPGDSAAVAAAQTGRLALRVRELDAPDSLRALLVSHSADSGAGAPADSLHEAMRLFTMLHDTPDPSGAALFLAGEVARDRLLAPRLSEAAWRSLLRQYPSAPLVPRTLAALALLGGPDAGQWRATLQAGHPASAEARWQRGESIVDAPDHRAANALLEGRWAIAIGDAGRSP